MKLAASLLLCTGLVFAESDAALITVSGSNGGDANAQTIRLRQFGSPNASRKTVEKSVFRFPGDTVLPQLVDGGGWKTTLIFHNMETKTVRFEVYFLDDDGNDLAMNLPGLGTGSVMRFSLPGSATRIVETQGTAAKLAQGWAYIAQDNFEDSLGSMAVFKTTVPGRADQEAVVSVANEFSNRFVMVYDNTQGFATSVALANPSPRPAAVEVALRDETGQLLKQRSLQLTPFQHQAFSLASAWPEIANQKGSIEFRVNGGSLGVGALGLRFHPSGAFTSFQSMQNIAWIEE